MSAMVRPTFMPARELVGAFYREIVGPLLADRSHAAALLGWGSDVLGFDTERSTDHGWGPRLLVFLDDDADVPAVNQRVATGLPERFQGWPVRYGWDEVPADHRVTVTTLSGWLIDHLGVDATLGMGPIDWLVTPQQRLLGVTSGAVYADQTGELTRVRNRLAWYPDDVWRWLLACQWRRLAQEEAFVQRTAEVGDELGSAVIANRLARDVMRLALLLERRYAPYSKWLGTAFARLDQTDGLGRHLEAAVHARDLEQREPALARAYEASRAATTVRRSPNRWIRPCGRTTAAPPVCCSPTATPRRAGPRCAIHAARVAADRRDRSGRRQHRRPRSPTALPPPCRLVAGSHRRTRHGEPRHGLTSGPTTPKHRDPCQALPLDHLADTGPGRGDGSSNRSDVFELPLPAGPQARAPCTRDRRRAIRRRYSPQLRSATGGPTSPRPCDPGSDMVRDAFRAPRDRPADGISARSRRSRRWPRAVRPRWRCRGCSSSTRRSRRRRW